MDMEVMKKTCFLLQKNYQKNFVSFRLEAPYTLQPYGYAWYAINFDAEQGKWSDEDQARTSRELMITFIDEACETYQLNKDNITLLGFSQGTILSYAVGLSYPSKIKNIIALSGYINENILLEGYQELDHNNLQIYASHGMVDQVIPPEWAQKAPGILKELGVACTYEEFPVGHGVAPKNFYSFKKWLSDKI